MVFQLIRFVASSEVARWSRVISRWGFGRRWSWPILRYSSDIHLDKLIVTMTADNRPEVPYGCLLNTSLELCPCTSVLSGWLANYLDQFSVHGLLPSYLPGGYLKVAPNLSLTRYADLSFRKFQIPVLISLTFSTLRAIYIPPSPNTRIKLEVCQRTK
jgi:hypothetical protein